MIIYFIFLGIVELGNLCKNILNKRPRLKNKSSRSWSDGAIAWAAGVRRKINTGDAEYLLIY